MSTIRNGSTLTISWYDSLNTSLYWSSDNKASYTKIADVITEVDLETEGQQAIEYEWRVDSLATEHGWYKVVDNDTGEAVEVGPFEVVASATTPVNRTSIAMGISPCF